VLWAQEKKDLSAYAITEEPTIDGVLDEAMWSQAESAQDFIETRPSPGDPASQPTEVKVIYDQEAVYIGAKLYDSAPDSILQQLTARDRFGNADHFGVFFDCYRDGINGLGFIVTASGVQLDVKYSQFDDDRSWNAVWWSKVSITDEGWVVEMKIPYAAIRFPEIPEQLWHINFERNIRRIRETSYWNPVDPAVNGLLNQSGLLRGVKGITPPLRLFLFPYATTYLDNNETIDEGWQEAFQGGMDLKYGISDAFTLDMTLIPDFGQVQSDNLILNLTPFEVFFNEQRQFFTEGTELFNKADLFYSRRIGGTPIGYWNAQDELEENEVLIRNPSTTRLINASKVSGRNSAGTGVGIFNAITANTWAEAEDTETGETRRILTDPMSNYNVLVIDQNLWQNSYVSLVNTNVFRDGSAYEANVTGTEYRLTDKSNRFHILGTGALSQKYYSDSTALGHKIYTELEKISGKWTYGVNHNYESETYDPNDLGFLQNANESSFNGFLQFNQFEPLGPFNEFDVSINPSYSRLANPDKFQNFTLLLRSFFNTRDFHAFGIFGRVEPVETYDWFEPRTPGRFYAFPTNRLIGGWISTDYRRRFAFDINIDYRDLDQGTRDIFVYAIEPRFRFNDKLLTILSYRHRNMDQDEGWVNFQGDDIIFGTRDVDTYETILNVEYVFTDLMALTFRLRHLWTRVEYLRYGALDEQGYLAPTSYTGLDENGVSRHNANFNAFNIDMVYTWVFSPGSELRFVWKNSILGTDRELLFDHWENLGRTLEFDQINSLSLRLSYFLDYRSLTGKVRQPDWGGNASSSTGRRRAERRVMGL
jgi:hypothetical protein